MKRHKIKSKFAFTYKLWIIYALVLIIIVYIIFYQKSIRTISAYTSCKPRESCFGGASINLRSNNTFEYFYGDCLQNFNFNGIWNINKDTLILDGIDERNNRMSFNKTKFIMTKDSLLKSVDTSIISFRVYYKYL